MNQSAIARFRDRYGPWAIVAGASTGLGAEFATQLTANGLNVVLIARRADLLSSLAAKLSADSGAEYERCNSIWPAPMLLPSSRPRPAISTSGC